MSKAPGRYINSASCSLSNSLVSANKPSYSLSLLDTLTSCQNEPSPHTPHNISSLPPSTPLYSQISHWRVNRHKGGINPASISIPISALRRSMQNDKNKRRSPRALIESTRSPSSIPPSRPSPLLYRVVDHYGEVSESLGLGLQRLFWSRGWCQWLLLQFVTLLQPHALH